ncbi:hypothetical protein AB0J86_35535 [Micromonospora sp. NPDC049559]|uniref:hypothetical protein n=1 Tax=Micromonospora sp. NPDC049559 TaxID=3155923 RepID=UPI0034191EE2
MRFRFHTLKDTSVVWRLVGDNHRPLGTSPGSFPDLDRAARAAAAVRAAAGTASYEAALDDQLLWRWQMRVEGEEPLAVAVRPYQRRIDCVRAARRFQEQAPTATLDARTRF